MICKICNNSQNNHQLEVNEMMMGLKEIFEYTECSKCGCLQINAIPEEMNKYYAKNYYSYEKQKEKTNHLINTLIMKRNEYCLFKKNFLGKLVNIKYPNSFYSTLGYLNINYYSKILDVGCGAGKFLYELEDLNFKRLTGIDPYIENETHTEHLTIMKKNLHHLPDEEKFDFIFLNHSFEHLSDPLESLLKVQNILSKDGTCIIGMPLKTDYIWQLYGVNWVQIDAPRHFFIQTSKSFDILLGKTDLEIQKTLFDSYELQFWGSEQYKRDIPLNAANSYAINPENSIFTAKQIYEFKKCAKKLNDEKCGDQAIFFLKKVNNETKSLHYNP